MTQYFSYIGDPDAPPFQWDQPDQRRYRIGNLPLRVMPDNWGDLGIDMDEVMRLAREGVYEGRQIDWGAWALRMTGQQLQEFFSGDAGKCRLAAGLELQKTYLLVAAEGV